MFGKIADFIHTFLHIILTKVALTCLSRLKNCLDGFSFTYREKLHTASSASTLLLCALNLCSDMFNVLLNTTHSQTLLRNLNGYR
ncbi:Uncharacterised protein [Vibrio cholerae]|nr:Uncharacterised protein [Vibrio cholerae]CSE05987.1 Uncharacterised protein [Vibrio cholerae]